MAAPARGPAKGPTRGSSRGAPQSNPLLDPGATLSGNALNQAAHQIANAQTSGPIAELAKARAQQLQQGAGAQRQTAGYFNQLGQFATQGLNAQTGIANDLNSQLQGIADQTQQRIQGLGQGQLAQYANRVGGDFRNVGMPSLASTLGQQQATALNNSQSFRDFGATQGANFRNLAAANLGVYASRGQEDLANIGRATRLALEPLNAKMAGLRAQQGSLYGTALGSLRSQERNYQLARGALGLRQQSLANTVQNDRARNALALRGQNVTLNGQQLSQMRSDRQFQLDRQKFGAKQAQQRWASDPNAVGSPAWGRTHKGSGGGVGGRGGTLPATSQAEAYRTIDSVAALISQAQASKLPASRIKAALANGTFAKGVKAVDPLYIEAAYELLGWGYVLPQTARAMNSRGLRGGSFTNPRTGRSAPITVHNAPQQTAGQAIGGAGAALSGFRF